MTREEAIEALTSKDVCNSDIMLEALEMAIKALEQEPCDDAISRKAVIDLVVANHTELNGLNVVMYSPLFKDIKQLPPVNPQPKTGHWVKKSQYGNDYCSECGYELLMYGKTEYCPNCGAKMESED